MANKQSSPLSLLLPCGGATLFLLHLLLLHHLPLSSTSPTPHFEGFDSDDDVTSLPSDVIDTAPPLIPPPTSLSPSPESKTHVSTIDYYDEDEFEGIFNAPQIVLENTQNAEKDNFVNNAEVDSNSEPDLSIGSVRNEQKSVLDYYVEILCVSFLCMFLINYFAGKRENEGLALAWATKFASKDSIFDKNFSLLGIGEGDDSPLLLKEGQNTFRFYASGRRFCQGMLATLELKSRHDLISRLYNCVVRCKDEMTIEVFMNDDAMDHVVFALARKKMVKTMQKEVRDLQRFAGLVATPSGRKWVADELAVVAESKEVAGDMITEAVLDQVFGDKAFEKIGRLFMSMHFSDHYLGSQRKRLVFKFAIPDIKDMADMTRLVALVPYYIDLIGRYKLSSHTRSKTGAVRQKIAQEIQKHFLNARQEDLKKRKIEARKMLEEAEAKLSSEALRKKDAKELARQRKKAMPKITKMR
ncbi:hypothetical protein Leryth_018330 [Lithospermum erythrorhizon]|nr:hypothetical protein Leryth_018330 [Lithospermum erythrorhizon]